MEKIPVLVSGLPGKMARMVAERIMKSEMYGLVPISLTGEDTEEKSMAIDSSGGIILLAKPSRREIILRNLKEDYPDTVAIDFSLPSAVNGNAKFFCEHNIPFVMGTTGGDRYMLGKTINDSDIPAVVSANMSIPVVLMMAMIEYGAKTFPGVLKDFSLFIEESHQKAKVDPSGTVKTSTGPNLKTLGTDYSEEDIRMIRTAREQVAKGIPIEFLGGHGYHSYTMHSPDGTVDLQFRHNVRGRDTYIDGTKAALDYLMVKIANGERGYFNMIDVMRGMQTS